ncbi:unnamed protein product, partial [Sphenostylis stenocarpa]
MEKGQHGEQIPNARNLFLSRRDEGKEKIEGLEIQNARERRKRKVRKKKVALRAKMKKKRKAIVSVIENKILMDGDGAMEQAGVSPTNYLETNQRIADKIYSTLLST